MISVKDALAYIRSNKPTPTVETVAVAEAMGRMLAQDIDARIDMPPFSAANMDGYAVSDCKTGDQLKIIGKSAAGHPFDGEVMPGTAVRISTGAMLPNGSDQVLIQELAATDNSYITVIKAPSPREHVRTAASDFSTGERLIESGRRLNAANLSLAVAAGHAEVTVNRKLKVAIFSSGDELRPTGTTLKLGEIYIANSVGLRPLLNSWGSEVTDFGILGDSPEAIAKLLPRLSNYDIIIPIGGASVGDHDHMRPAFKAADFNMAFESVAVRPGKPAWMGTKADQVVLGLPGNPASAFVCAHLFLRPLLGLESQMLTAILGAPIEENGPREIYLRARANVHKGQIHVTPENAQESFRLRPQSNANALVKVPPMGGPYCVGDIMDIILTGELVAAE